MVDKGNGDNLGGDDLDGNSESGGADYSFSADFDEVKVTTGATSTRVPRGKAGDVGGIVTARGTGDGLVIRLDGRVDPVDLEGAIIEFIGRRRAFLQGSEVKLEWISKEPEDSQLEEVKALLKKKFKISVLGSSLRQRSTSSTQVEMTVEQGGAGEDSSGLFGGIDRFGKESAGGMKDDFGVEGLSSGGSGGIDSGYSGSGYGSETKSSEGVYSEANVWDDPDARIIYRTLRSGQRIETEHSLIIVGDVNSGAEIVAGGDIIVLGKLRGVAHAGAYDETGGGRFIYSQQLEPTQLRIGMVITKGSGEDGGSEGSHGVAEIATVDGNIIAVEPYDARQFRRGR